MSSVEWFVDVLKSTISLLGTFVVDYWPATTLTAGFIALVFLISR